MPRNKGKTGQNRKTLSFFRVNFGYVPPYYVLCDGDMIFQSLKNDLYLKQSLPNILNAPAQPAITSCVLEDLRRRGSEFSNAALFAKRVTRLPCAHEDALEVTECLLQRLRKASETKLMIAAANVDLLKNITRIPGIPLISILNRTKLVLKPPNKPTLDYVRDNEKIKTQTISDADKSLLESITADKKGKRPPRANIRKKRKAKGPNPLSVKKSTKESRKQADAHQEGKDNGAVQQNFEVPSKVEKRKISDSVSGQQHTSTSGKRKRGRRRASKEENGVDEGEDTSPPRKARRKEVSVSNSIECKLNTAVRERSGIRIGDNPVATVNSPCFEVKANNNTLEQGPGKEAQAANSIKEDANRFAPAESPKQDHRVCSDRKQDDWKEKHSCTPAGQLGVAEEPQSSKRKKQRKNRRRRPSKK